MRRLAGAIGILALAVLVGATPVTLARFTDAPATGGSLSTGSIAPPTGLAASLGGTTVTLAWIPSTSTIVGGYDVLRSSTSGSGYSTVAEVSPRAAATTTDTPGNGTWFYVLRSTFQSWRSVASNEASVSLGPVSTGFKGCSSNASDTGGDGNGYETNAASACADDGAAAVDSGSGTSGSTSCTDAGKDRHRFWGYSFGLPSGASINGITVQADAGLNNNGGTSILCVELSWDGGSTWTGAKQATMTGAALSMYTFGGSADTWGRSWSASTFASASFRVRVTDVTSQPNKDFRLDAILVAVSYTP